MSDLLTEQYRFRSALVKRLERDLVGPHSEHEVLDDAPIEQYIAGVLYPRSSETVAPEQDLDAPDEDEETGSPDPPVSLANRRYPSSVGITFAVDRDLAPTVTVEIAAARYEEIADETDASSSSDESTPAPSTDDEQDRGRRGRSWRWTGREGRGSRWQRVPLRFDPIDIDVTSPGSRRVALGEGLQLFYRVRSPDGGGAAPVTVALVNQLVVKTGMRDSSSFFQPTLKVVGSRGAPGAFVERPSGMPPAGDEDLQSYKLIYRHARNFGVGHGCAVTWTVDDRDPSRASEVETTFVPQYELRLADSNRRIDESALGMRFFAQGPRDEVASVLAALCDGYSSWIEAVADDARTALDGQPELREAAHRHIEAAERAVRRMRGGVELLRTHARAWEAFRLANAAMLEQRARSDWIRAGAPAGGPAPDDSHRWRPFQIAFILMCLEDTANPKSPTRREVDLLWFPTGGGKTEAYLGLIAFTVFHRRLRNPAAGGGVTALMRYTLRLLTIQQFERAALLLAACEAIRQSRDDLGSDPISIGLWVGQGATPNTLDEAEQALRKLQVQPVLERGNPVQLRRCPWCGRALDHRNYYVRRDRSRMVIACRSVDCAFADGLPVFVVDEDVYQHRPTLVIATVDKFASLPWREQTAALFNLDHPDPPPELIVQDELHLISGPLGTLTGLYETAIDALATHDGVGPKIVASTATIRRAGEQTRGLFARAVNQFPPPGIDARDSYFAVEVPPDEKGTRLYVGVCAPGTSQTTLLIRTYAALLQGAAELPGGDDVRDPYWTLVGYFNSLRVLGAATIQVRDDVNDRIALLASRSGRSARTTDQQIELTSREASSEIPGHLKHMEVQFPDPQALDVILATNMISVGVDVDRLGLMVVAGQPQSTSEYIQSTSRVGRRHPGLVVTMLNAAKSRDRSHYESFVGFHSALYRQVEASSVTPFSPRARDRGLHAVLVALSRLMYPQFRANKSAGDIGANHAAVESALRLIVDRARAVDGAEAAHTEAHLRRIVSDWHARADEGGTLFFNNPRVPESTLLSAADDLDAEGFPTLWSLRDVDAESHLYLD